MRPDEGCSNDSDCVGGQCSGTKCIANCMDAVKNNAETDVDCGPGCPPCGAASACSSNADCASAFCADGVCCDQPCDQICMACVQAKTGVADGTCAPIPINQDPDTECDPQATVEVIEGKAAADVKFSYDGAEKEPDENKDELKDLF